jgi:hypothetical protein
MSGHDSFDIVDAALRIDGVSDTPSFEFHGISDFLRNDFLPESEQYTHRLSTLIRVLAKAIESVSESRHSADSDNLPSTIIFDLNNAESNFKKILMENSERISNVHVQLTPITASLVGIQLQPGYWQITTGISGTLLSVVVIPTNQESTFKAFDIKTIRINFSGKFFQCHPVSSQSLDGRMEFETVIPNTIGGSTFEVFIDDQHVKVQDDPRTGGLDQTVAIAGSQLPTVPILYPNSTVDSGTSKSVCCVGMTSAEIISLQKMRPHDIFLSIPVPENHTDWRIRDILQACEDADCVYVSSRLLTNGGMLLAGLVMGWCNQVHVMGDHNPDVEQLVAQLKDQGIIR